MLIDCYIQVGRSYRVKGADYAMESIHNLKEAVPELWDADIKAQVECPGTEKLAVETSDIAWDFARMPLLVSLINWKSM